MNLNTAPKALIKPMLKALRDFDEHEVKEKMARLARDTRFRHCHPFGTLVGADAFFTRALRPLMRALPDLERRDLIVISGTDEHGAVWVGCCGMYVGTFEQAFLDIPPTGRIATMRFHEFYRIEDVHIAEAQIIWDIPELMMQANAWPLSPSLGTEKSVMAPMSQDGLAPHSEEQTAASVQHVIDMLAAMLRHPNEPVSAMQLDKFWHPNFNWYGPAGIGTARGVRGFRNWHQVPFLAAMPDRGQYSESITHHFFGEGDYVAVTGWPNMVQTLSGSGWLGLPPTNQIIELRSLDFWRLENGLIRENWVLVDMLDMYRQVDVDVLARMREFNKARQGFNPETGVAL